MSQHTPNQSVAATAHFVESERLVEALPLVKRGDRDNQLRLALVHAVLAIAAGTLGGPDQWRTVIEPEGTGPAN
jgi:hypothetical protein